MIILNVHLFGKLKSSFPFIKVTGAKKHEKLLGGLGRGLTIFFF